MNGFIPCWDCKSWASQREGHTTGKNKNLNLGLPGSRHALNLVNEWISEWVQGSSIVTWVHLFIFMTQRIGKKSILSKMLPPHPSSEWDFWQNLRGHLRMWRGYWFVLSASCELFSALSPTQMENCQTDVGICQSPTLKEAFIMDSFVNSSKK